MIRLLLLLLILVTPGCRQSVTSPSPPAPAEQFPFVRVGAEVDKEGNLLEAYAYDGEINIEQLKRFVKSKRQLANARTFYSMYLFDAADNVRYPSDPSLATGFNILKDEDIEAMKHVRASYNTTNFNKFSELYIYETNSYESTAKRYNID